MEFSVGTRVVLIKADGHIPAGETGVVCQEQWDLVDPRYVGVELDNPAKYTISLHDCCGHCEERTGRYFLSSSLEILDSADDHLGVESDEEFEKFLYGVL